MQLAGDGALYTPRVSNAQTDATDRFPYTVFCVLISGPDHPRLLPAMDEFFITDSTVRLPEKLA
jgi:hypothetical protein